LEQNRFDFFLREDKRHEHGLAASMLIGGQARQAIAAVDQLFDCEEQELILRHKEKATGLMSYSDLPAAAPDAQAH
jgi:hypothetical protein